MSQETVKMDGITVVIATLNRTEYLLRTLQDLVVQDFRYAFEILVVDQSDKYDKSVSNFCLEFPNIKYFHISMFRGLPEARNFGWQKSAFECILYLDDDIQCKSNLLDEHYRLISQSEVGIVAGGITEVNNKNIDCSTGVFLWTSAMPLAGFHKDGVFEVDHARGANFSSKKSILRQVCGVDEQLTKGAALYEETDLCLRVKKAGYKIIFSSAAHVHHLAAKNGGCRVKEIDNYLFGLIRNTSLIISRHLKPIHRLTAHLHLLKLVFAYVFTYKQLSLLHTYTLARKEGTHAGRNRVRCTNYS